MSTIEELVQDGVSVGRQFHRLRPEKDDLFELKTPDLRAFGWFYKKDTFIAVNACDMERVKTHNLYAGFRDETVRERNKIDLDEPTYINRLLKNPSRAGNGLICSGKAPESRYICSICAVFRHFS